MNNSTEEPLAHDIELYPPETFAILLAHEINRSRRYGQPLTLLYLAFETHPKDPQTQHSAEVFLINLLDLNMRDTDIPCKKENEFMVLMPATDERGGRLAGERLEKLLHTTPQQHDQVPFELSVFIGIATLPGGHSVSGKQLLENASRALEYARINRLKNIAVFSEMIG